MEPNKQDITPDEAMANLAFANNLQEQLMPKGEQPVEGEITPENAPGQPQTGKMENTPNHDMKAEMDDFRKEMRNMVKQEIGGIKQDIKDLIAEDEQE